MLLQKSTSLQILTIRMKQQLPQKKQTERPDNTSGLFYFYDSQLLQLTKLVTNSFDTL